MKSNSTEHKNHIVILVRTLVLILFLFGLALVFLLLHQKSTLQKFTDTSINYHLRSIILIEALDKDVHAIMHRLESGPVILSPKDINDYIQQQRYLKIKFEELLKIQQAYNNEELDFLYIQMGERVDKIIEFDLFALIDSQDFSDFLISLHSFELTLEQLHRFHHIKNAELLEMRSKRQASGGMYLLVAILVIIAGALIVTRNTIFSIRSILARQKLTEEQLYDEKERSQTTLASIGDAVIVTDINSVITYMNPVAEELTRWAFNEVKGRPLGTVFNIINEETGAPAGDISKRVLRDGLVVGLANHTVLIARDGSKVAIEDSAAPIRDSKGKIAGIVIVFHDVTHARQMAQELSWQASHDALTKLVNRHRFEMLLREQIDSIDESIHHHAFLYMDLDQFKLVNDTCGHIAGDELLKQVSKLIKSQVRDVDTVARLGGDEFGLLLPSCPIDRAVEIANHIRESIKNFHFVWEDRSFSIGASIGLVSISDSTMTVNEVMRTADIACYAAKDIGRNRVHVYQPDDDDMKNRQGEMEWVGKINDALKEDRFILYFQKILPFNEDNTEENFEVLLRMIGEEGEEISPMKFIPSAERYNLMPLIDRWVIENTFRKMKSFRDKRKYHVSINISGQSLGDDEFLKFVNTTFKEIEMPSSLVCFEITETAAISNFPQALHFIQVLRQNGCKFSLDDFGSGLSSFGYLKNLAVDYLKIDGSFVRDIIADATDRAMVQAIISIGHTMNIKTIAEFVENDEVADMLRNMGVDYGQGYGLHRPEPL